MKLVQAATLESIADYRIVEAERPKAGPGQLVVRVVACGLGYVDSLIALGRYQVKPPLPFTPGQEIGGVVEEIGEGVSALAVGDRVMASASGGLAEFARTPAQAALRIPPAMSFEQAAVLRVNYVTALHALKDRAQLKAGERLLVLGAAGGVGAAAVQIGKLLGAEVIAAASSEAKRAFAQAHGADHVLDTEPKEWRDRLKAACGGKGPDIVFDPVCGPLFEPAFRSLAWGGRHLVIGFAGGPIPALPANLPLMKGAALTGVDVRQFFLYDAAIAAAHIGTLLQWIAEGKLAPAIGRRFPLAQFADAMEFAISGQGLGKPVVEVSAP